MSGYTIRTPNTVNTTLFQDGQAAASITPGDARDLFASGMSTMSNTQATSYTLLLSDAWLCVEMNSATGVTLTLPPAVFQVGTVVEWYQMNAGTITFVAGAGVTIRTASSLTSRAQFASGAVRLRASNEYVLMGDLT